MPRTVTSASAATQARRRRGPAEQGGEHRDPLGEPGLLGEGGGGEQHAGGDGAARAAHPPGGVQAADAEREEQRVDPADVEPGVGGEVGRGEHARGAGPGRDAARLALDQATKQREAGERGHQGHQPQRQVGDAEHASRRGRHGEVERRVPVGDVPDGRRRVQRLAGQDAVHLDQRVALQPLDGERVEPAQRDEQVGADRDQAGQRRGQPRGARSWDVRAAAAGPPSLRLLGFGFAALGLPVLGLPVLGLPVFEPPVPRPSTEPGSRDCC